MKKILAVLLVTFMLLPAMAFAGEDLEKLKADYRSVVESFGENLQSQQLLIEGFKATNSTYKALVTAQQRLQEQAKALNEKIKELEAPEPEIIKE